MKKIAIIITSLFLSFITLYASGVEVELKKENHSNESVKTAIGKSQKIVDKLAIIDNIHRENVLHVIANRYLELNEIYTEYNARNERIKTKDLDQKAMDDELERSYYECNSALYRSRFGYITWLSFYLNEDQIDVVKNEMTDNMLKVRYDDFLDMLPELTDEQKNRIYAWLVEAREFSIDFDTGRKMRQMFTKYRGRINNYLSKCGYNISKASEEQKNRRLNQ